MDRAEWWRKGIAPGVYEQHDEGGYEAVATGSDPLTNETAAALVDWIGRGNITEGHVAWPDVLRKLREYVRG